MEIRIERRIGLKFLFVAAVLLSLIYSRDGLGQGFDAYEEKININGKEISFMMKPVVGGKYTMGSVENEVGRRPDEGPVHTTLVDSLWMGQYEVTWELFDLFMAKEMERHLDEMDRLKLDGISRPSPAFEDPSLGMGKEGYPVVNVSPYSAITFCKWLSAITGEFYRLPTEAEWEYACRAGSDAAYYFGDQTDMLADHAVYFDNSNGQYAKVGSKKPNQLGLYDMLGNVSEWTLDLYAENYYSNYTEKEADNPWNIPYVIHPRVYRGGSWDDDPQGLRCATRYKSGVGLQRGDPQVPKSFWWYTNSEFIGFRVVRPYKQMTQEEIKKFWAITLDE